MPHCALVSAILLGLVSSLAAQSKPAASLPPGEKDAKARIESSPRHGEYVDVKVPGREKPVRSYVVYPEVKEKAPVVIVIHEIYGLTDWIKAVTDQLAADGFIAIAPDLLSGKGPKGGGTEEFPDRDSVTKAVRSITPEEATAALDAVRKYGFDLPSSNLETAVIGFCWGGAQSFAYGAKNNQISGAVVYYGASPAPEALTKIGAPVLGLYGSDDVRVNPTIEPAKNAIGKSGGVYRVHMYEGAGHGFLRQQDGKDGANLKAAQQAWPETIKFIRRHAT
jgi:carboxymethylenebutenolidase